MLNNKSVENDDLEKFLNNIGLKRMMSVFKAKKIDLKFLLTCRENELEHVNLFILKLNH